MKAGRSTRSPMSRLVEDFRVRCCRNITTDGFPGMKMPLPDGIVFIAERFGYEFHALTYLKTAMRWFNKAKQTEIWDEAIDCADWRYRGRAQDTGDLPLRRRQRRENRRFSRPLAQED